MGIEVVDVAGGSRLLDEWDELAAQAAASPFRYPGWVLRWHHAFGRRVLGAAVLRDRRGTLLALLPLHLSRIVWSSPTNWHSGEFGALADSPEAEYSLVAGLVHRAPCVSLSFLQTSDTRAMAAAARDSGARVHGHLLLEAPYLDIENRDWADYFAGLSGNVRGDVGRRLRRLSEQVDVQEEVTCGQEEFADRLEEAWRVEASGWKGERGTAIASRPETAWFYESIARWAARRGWLRLTLVRAGGRAIAADLALVHRGVYFGLKCGYDESFRQYSPGKILSYFLLRWAFQERLLRFNMLGRADPWKLRWTSTVEPHYRLEIFPDTLRGRIGWTVAAYGRPAARRALAAVRSRRDFAAQLTDRHHAGALGGDVQDD